MRSSQSYAHKYKELYEHAYSNEPDTDSIPFMHIKPTSHGGLVDVSSPRRGKLTQGQHAGPQPCPVKQEVGSKSSTGGTPTLAEFLACRAAAKSAQFSCKPCGPPVMYMCQPNANMHHYTPAASKKRMGNNEKPMPAAKAAKKVVEVVNLVDSYDEAEADSNSCMKAKQESMKEDRVVKEEHSDEEEYEEEEDDDGTASMVMENDARKLAEILGDMCTREAALHRSATTK